MGQPHSSDFDHCALQLNFDLKFTGSLVTRLTPPARLSAQWGLNPETFNSIATLNYLTH